MEKVDKTNMKEVRDYFTKFSSWIKSWRSEYADFGLTNPTFKALMQTTAAIMDLSEYLIEEDNDIGYILLGFLQQDFLEGRFGWWRQLSGGNYFCSVLQFLQAEKTIRLRNLIDDGYNLKDIKNAFEYVEEKKNLALQLETDDFLDMIEEYDFSTLFVDDRPVTYYVAGYIARRLIKQTKCQHCHTLFSKSQENITVEVDETNARPEDLKAGEEFIDAVSRGGLTKPSELLNIVCAHANDLWRYIKNNSRLRATLLSSTNSRSVFTNVFVAKLEHCVSTESITKVTCRSGHSYVNYISIAANVMFNIFGKNYASDINSNIHKGRKRDKPSAGIDVEAEKRDPMLMKQSKVNSVNI